MAIPHIIDPIVIYSSAIGQWRILNSTPVKRTRKPSKKIIKGHFKNQIPLIKMLIDGSMIDKVGDSLHQNKQNIL